MSWDYLGCSHIGQMHKKLSMCNQDAWRFKRFERGFCAVVSDGLGSKKNSHIGSRMACKSVLRAYKTISSNLDLSNFIGFIIDYWKQSALPYGIKECSATCLFVCCIDSRIMLSRLGDGLIIAWGKHESRILSDSKDGSFLNITNALSENTKPLDWEFYIEDEGVYDNFLLATDGISSDLIESSQKDFAEAFINYYSSLPQKGRYGDLRSCLSRWHLRGSSDDKTILGVVRG